ncbi:MAG: FtsK/SpoIIIE domain-containing protein [Jatrophihabitantaceae bacterium]
MQIDLTVRDQTGADRDVTLSAPADATVGAVRDCVLSHVNPRCALDPAALWCGRRLLADDELAVDTGLRHGAVLSLGGPEPERVGQTLLQLRVVGGPDAGLTRPLTGSVLTLGRAVDCDVRLTDPTVSRRHAALTLAAGGIRVDDLNSTNNCLADGIAIGARQLPIQPAAMLRFGDTLCQLTSSVVSAADVRRRADGTFTVNRPPRLSGSPQTETIELPVEPNRGGPQRVQWIAAIVPAIAGVALAYFLHAPAFLLFALLSPIIILATALGDRVHWRRERRRSGRVFRERSALARHQIAAALAAEERRRRHEYLDPTAVADLAATPGQRLWERRRTDHDLLRVRLGLGADSARLQTRVEATTRCAGQVHDVPGCVDLRAGPLGIAAPSDTAAAVARWVFAQLAVNLSPADLEFVLLLSPDAAHRWRWMRWLPHLRSGGTTVADDPRSQRALIAELGSIATERSRQRGAGQSAWSGRWIVLLVDQSSLLNELPELDELLRTGPAVGITAVCLDTRESCLPAAVCSVATISGELGTRLLIRAGGADPRGFEIVSDQVSYNWSEQLARDLAPLVDPGGDAMSAIPQMCRLLEVLDLADPTPSRMLQLWAASDGRPVATLGVGRDTRVRIDLVRDGPHALVAGTTGAGKSELLQTWIASLVCEHPPAELSFVLIDYKGGAAFGDCAQLPHVVGLVTDLDAHLVRRALRSLNGELKRRESLFADAGAKDLDAYRSGHPVEPLPRLILMVDEFATLAEELPEFVGGLIAVAQRGRSLGVHLILATQRPAGVVSPEIRANTALRIALRVTSPGDSSDVIDATDAAGIDPAIPGRAFLRTGSGLTQFQTARTGGPTPLTASAAAIVIRSLDPWRRDATAIGSTGPGGPTDLAAVATAAAGAAELDRLPRQRTPWLPVLPTLLPAAQLPGPLSGDAIATDSVVIGLQDLPDHQMQNGCVLTLDGGSVLFAGGPRSGRTTSLLSLTFAALQQHGPRSLHVHYIDCAGGGLADIAGLPHCGTATSMPDFDTAERLLDRLAGELNRRTTELARLQRGSVAEARATGQQIPLLLLLLDGWEQFVAAAEDHGAGRAVERLLALLRAAPAGGLTVAISGDRAALAPRLAAAVGTKFVLPLLDQCDYALAAIPAQAVPRHRPPGRAIRVGDAVEVQIAHLGDAPTRTAQRLALTEAASASAARPTGWQTTSRVPTPADEPIRITPLPTSVSLRELSATPRPALGTSSVLLGLGGDHAEPIAVDLFSGCARLLVAGPPRSGRSTLLGNVLTQVTSTRSHLTIVVAAPNRSLVTALARKHGVAAARQARGPTTLANIVLLAPDSPPPQLPTGRTLLLVDDCEAFSDVALGETLTAWLKQQADGFAAVVTGRNDDLAVTYRGIGAEMRRAHCAVLLQPTALDGELAGVTLPRRRPTTIPGRGLLIVDPAWTRPTSEPRLGPAANAGPTPIQLALG